MVLAWRDYRKKKYFSYLVRIGTDRPCRGYDALVPYPSRRIFQ